ncbi:Anti-sigma-V factor RsiV [Neobacillus rhizosphaerae]|uniref:Anti-sigma-V factor RsiV n=1 Tax=Neobacillus rhizosphaerae TaxID=2880965 RepID=A0ABN8KP19_9BACI|nr:anti-sigma-V factor rsiV [Neobacillus rhizosphaerae]CAH2715344.1 Anti-sigma-V factor RsiV [Neobacillus rhizosphaerae]
MNKKMEALMKEYNEIPIPSQLDFVVKKALNQKPKKRILPKVGIGLAAAATLFIGGLNASPTFANTMAEVPALKNVVKVLTFREFKVDEETYQADIKVPAIKNLDNKELQSTLNQKYLKESKELYQQFQADMKDLKESGGGHLGVTNGYEVKTDNDQLLSIGRYTVNTVGSSSTTFQFDTIDKKNKLLITLPSLFKSDAYVDLISKEIRKQMITQMEQDSDLTYWVKNPNKKDDNPLDTFEKIQSNQNFYINKQNKLVIGFDKYEVAPGYMGVVEFIIPTDVLKGILVSDEYVK